MTPEFAVSVLVTMRELRGCLFFEQRPWHKRGQGFDAETMSYL